MKWLRSPDAFGAATFFLTPISRTEQCARERTERSRLMTRAASLTAALSFLVLGEPAAAQLHDHWHGPGAVRPRDFAHGGIRGAGSPYGYSYAPFGYSYGYGFGHDAYYGPGLGVYRGPVWGGINPPVYVYPPYGYGFGYGYGPAWGYGSAWYPPARPDPLNNSLLQAQYDNDWTRLSAQLADRALRNVDDPLAGTSAVPIPSSPEAKLKSLRLQAQGDEAFANQEFAKALDRYKGATAAARDDGRAFFKAGYGYFALGRFASALEYFKRGLTVDPMLAVTGPTPDEMYGDNQIAWTAHLGRATQWVREDVRDAQRVLLLGFLLFYDGDTRARELLEQAWQLSGGTEMAVVRLLNPPVVNEVKVVDPVPGHEGAGAEERQGPALVPDDPSEKAPAGELDLPEIPEPPALRPEGAAPLFPLPSEQSSSSDDGPPLPAE